MDRRKFLQTVSTALACGPALGKPASADVSGEHDDEALLRFAQMEDAPEEHRFAAAVFRSAAWGTCAQYMQFENGCLAGIDGDFPHETMIDISEEQFEFDAIKAPHLAIAVANPHDADSWRAAQTQCASVKRAGAALTLLFAAHPYPEYRHPFDPRMLTYEPEGGWMDGADVVIHFVTMNLRAEFPRMVFAMTHLAGSMPGCDLFDIRAGLEGGRRAVYFRDTACGRQRVARAMTFAGNHLAHLSFAHHGFNGGVVLMEANTWHVDELYEIVNRFKAALPNGSPAVIGRVEHYDVDPWMTVHAIVTVRADLMW